MFHMLVLQCTFDIDNIRHAATGSAEQSERKQFPNFVLLIAGVAYIECEMYQRKYMPIRKNMDHHELWVFYILYT